VIQNADTSYPLILKTATIITEKCWKFICEIESYPVANRNI
jgi:hypothetical protein